MSKPSLLKGRCHLTSYMTALSLGLLSAMPYAQVTPPATQAWWEDSSSGVLLEGAEADNYAIANIGQLKNTVAQTLSYLGNNGIDTNAILLSDESRVVDVVSAWEQSPEGNFAPANIGQVKHFAEAFWKFFIDNDLVRAEGRYFSDSDIPWTIDDASDDNNYAAVNIGQLKNAFTFNFINEISNDDSDGDGIIDLLETLNGLDPNNPWDAIADFDGDGIINRDEFALRTDVNSSDTDQDGLLDLIEIENGFDPLTPLTGNEPYADLDLDLDAYSIAEEIALGTSPVALDTECDGLPDWLEVKNADHDPLVSDSSLDPDGDNTSSIVEYVNKTNVSVAETASTPFINIF